MAAHLTHEPTPEPTTGTALAHGTPVWPVLGAALAAGWIGATVLASLLHLCPVVARALLVRAANVRP